MAAETWKNIFIRSSPYTQTEMCIWEMCIRDRDYYVYKIGVLTNNYPQSIALGMFKTIISVTLLFGANKLSQKMRGESIV